MTPGPAGEDRQRSDVGEALWKRAEPIIDVALDLSDAPRAEYIAKACDGDSSLQRYVERLIGFGLPSSGLLDRSPVMAEAPEAARRSTLDGGDVLGAYRIVHQIAAGGMGVVYLAERADGQFEQQVALKVIKLGMDSAEVHRRFLNERQILAGLSHPHIARLLDGGLSAGGQPYFVMEYVGGTPITAHCDAHRLTIVERLRLFADVCDAVRFAHRSLIVHRDLKPSNILVTDGGTVKLLDFGIAKVLRDMPDGGASQTVADRRVLTPGYAAPEQVRGERITTGTDVYALGAVVYELLAGRRAHRFGAFTPAEVERVVCRTEPELPSRAVATGGIVRADAGDHGRDDTLPADEVGRRRRTTAAQLTRLLAGDLDTIVLKTLHKDPDRRYPSVDALLDDLERYRTGRPVLARRDTLVYRTRKFVRRHRLAVISASTLALSLAGGVGGVVWQARATADEARRAQAAKEFLAGMFEQAAPERTLGDSLTARGMLDRAVNGIDSAFATQPDVRYDLHVTLGNVYRNLGVYASADSLFTRAARIADSLEGTGSLVAATARIGLGGVRTDEGRYADAESLLVTGLRILRQHRDQDTTVTATLRELGAVQRHRYEFRESEASYRQALLFAQRGDADSLTLARIWNDLAVSLYMAGRFAAADSARSRVLAIYRVKLPPDHPDLLLALGSLANSKQDRWQMDSAVALFDDVLRRERRLYPNGHDRVALSLNNLAWAQMQMGSYAAAESGFRESYEMLRRVSGPHAEYTLIVLTNIARTLVLAGRPAEALPILRTVRRQTENAHGPRYGFVSAPMYWIGRAYAAQGDTVRALAVLDSALRLAREALPPEHSRIPVLEAALGSLLSRAHRLREAEVLLRSAWNGQRANLPPVDPTLGETAVALAACLAMLGQQAEADSLFSEGIRRLSANPYRAAQASSARQVAQQWRTRWRARATPDTVRRGPTPGKR